MRKTCLNCVYELAKKDPRVVFIGSDIGAGTLDAFKRDFPDRFFMEGVGEANIIGLAAGLALNGKIVYINTLASFITRRCFEQVLLDLALHRARVRLIGSGGGLVYGPLGPTHNPTEDIALMRAVPGMTIAAPADAEEMKRLMPQTLEVGGPVYIRLGKGGDPVVTSPEHGFRLGEPVLARPGRDALLISTGVMLGPALRASDELRGEGVGCGVLHVHTVKPLDAAALLRAAEGMPVIATVEEHSVTGGLGGAVAEILMESGAGRGLRFRRLGLPDAFPDGYGSQAQLLERYGLTAGAIAENIRKMRR
ncbi:MAG TPA: transketolase C-terminal domain-containing protein [Elusimicrobiales bacterium]|nr:transketolase C-terminal domain-containing protein [Elusimicrobiales bacterium]